MSEAMQVQERDTIQEQLCARIDELEREKEVLARLLDRAEGEGNALASRVKFLNQQNNAQQEQNDALAAHVERLCAHIENAEELHPATWAVRGHKLIKESPTTSLARQKAQWQAEAVEAAVNAAMPGPPNPPDDPPAGFQEYCEGIGDVREAWKHLCRQAEEIPHAQ